MKFNNLSFLLAVALPLSGQARSTAPIVSLTSPPKRAFVSTTTSASAAALAEEIPSGGDSGPLSQAADLSAADAPLIADIEMLSNMLAEVVKRENPTVYDLYTRFRKHGMDRAANPNDLKPFEEMKKLAFDVSPIDNLGVMKTFSIALNLVNAAEVNHRMRLVREAERDALHFIGPLPNVEDSVRGTLEILLEKDNIDPDKIFEKLTTQKCEIVLTAHPTEVNRKTMLLKCKWTYSFLSISSEYFFSITFSLS
jgi:phosphoenolpyruvate carboxylase